MEYHVSPISSIKLAARQFRQRYPTCRRFVQFYCCAFVLLFIQGANAKYIEPIWHPHNGPGSYPYPEPALQAAKSNWDIQWSAHVACRTWGASYWGETGNYGSVLGGCAGGGVWAAPSCPSGYSYDQLVHKCWDGLEEPDVAFKGPPPPYSCAGNPINVTIGNKFQAETDYQPSALSSLNFTRSYNSLDGSWRHGFSSHLRFAGAGHVALVMHHGLETFFDVSGDTVTGNSVGSGVLNKIDSGWQYLSPSNERFVFDTLGKLIQWSDSQGASLNLSYSDSSITANDHLGNSLIFTEDSGHQPLAMSAPGLQIDYGYDARQRLISVVRVANGETTQRNYHYDVVDKPDLLTGITDERGVRYATWSYDAKGRAISSEHAGGADRVEVTYNDDGSSTVTNELGKKATYRFQTIQGIKRITAIEGEPSPNCPSSNSTFTYDDRGLLETKTDNKGIVTTYDYNDRGLEVSRTEASGTAQERTVTTDWHSLLYLPLVVTEPDRITRYRYNNKGKQISYVAEIR